MYKNKYKISYLNIRFHTSQTHLPDQDPSPTQDYFLLRHVYQSVDIICLSIQFHLELFHLLLQIDNDRTDS